MIKTLALLTLLGASALWAGCNLHQERRSDLNLATAAAARTVIEEYSRAVLTGNQELLDTVLHRGAKKQEYVRFPPRLSYAFKSYDRERLISAPRLSAAEWTSAKPESDQIEILAATEMTASASLSGVWGTEFLHLLRVQGGWQIIQVLGVDPGGEVGRSVAVVETSPKF